MGTRCEMEFPLAGHIINVFAVGIESKVPDEIKDVDGSFCPNTATVHLISFS